MSSKYLRTKLAGLLKEHKMGKLYTGRKSNVLRVMPSYLLRQMIYLLTLKPGSLVNDCDGFNHRVSDDVGHGGLFHYGFRGGSTFHIQQVSFDDGTYSCGCDGSPEAAKSREEIERFFGEITQEYIKEQRTLGWNMDSSQRMYDTIKNGGHICDENGLILPEFKENQ